MSRTRFTAVICLAVTRGWPEQAPLSLTGSPICTSGESGDPYLALARSTAFSGLLHLRGIGDAITWKASSGSEATRACCRAMVPTQLTGRTAVGTMSPFHGGSPSPAYLAVGRLAAIGAGPFSVATAGRIQTAGRAASPARVCCLRMSVVVVGTRARSCRHPSPACWRPA